MNKKKIKSVIPKDARKVFSSQRFHLYQWDQLLFDGKKGVYEGIRRKDSCSVIPVVGGKIVILKERQPHWHKDHTTTVGGQIEEGEDPFVGAAREAEEETGYRFKNIYLVGCEHRSVDIHYTHYTFIATDPISKKAPKLDPGERMTSSKVSIEKFIDMVRKRKFLHKPAFVDDFLIAGKEEKLKSILKNPRLYKIKQPAFEK